MDALFCPNDGSPLSLAPAGDGGMATVVPDPYLGRELSGHIEIRQLVGVGAMGRVYRAFQRGIDRDVAVKILHRELSANQQLVARFHREAKVASRLLHPNVVGVHLVGQLPDGSMYIVMEYLDGLSLQSALAAAGGAFDLPRALHVALQLCDATGEAHATGVVHRDLKPENVMLVRRGADHDFVKVLDFGIARLNWGEQSMATAAGLIFGTARYISPEGAQGEAVGPPGDVYATATLVYQMLAGRTPFEGEQAVALLVQQIHDPPPPLRSIVRASYVPEPIAEVVMRNLSKDPLAREPDGRALGRALMDAAKLAGLSAEDFVARPLLQSVRPAVQLPAMQRTSRMQLEPEVREALKSPAPGLSPLPPGGVPATAPMPAAHPAHSPVPPTPTPAAAATPEAKPAGVETTLDDIPAPPPAALGHDRTQKVQPLEALPPPAAPPGAMRGSFPSAPSPSFDAEEDLPESEPPEVKRRRARSRAVSLFVVCFLIGVIGAAVVAYKLGYVGQASEQAHSLAWYQSHARDAFRAQRWDTPPGDNVRDLTNDGLRKYPNDSRLLEIRANATDELVKDAVGEKYLDHMDRATHLAELAHELDPTDVAAANLVDEYHELGKAPEADAGGAVAELHDAGASPQPHNPGPSNGGHPNVAPVARATMDVNPAKPRVGQPVEVVVHLTMANAAPKTPPTDGSFTVSGPGVAPGTKVPSLADGTTTVRGALAFLEPGKFELTFTAKVDGREAKVVRSVVVAPLMGGGGGTNNATDGGKWL